MLSWQKRVRLGVALFGVVVAGIVYMAIGERQAPAPAEPVIRKDPRASAEFIGGSHEQYEGTVGKYKIEWAERFVYADGSTLLIKPRIIVPNLEGRDFLITADKATSGPEQKVLELVGAVSMRASDGFALSTERASHNQDDWITRVPGPATFSRGRMSGSGVGMTFEHRSDVLTIDSALKVTVTDEAETVSTAFEAGNGALDRMAHVLTLDGGVRALRSGQTLEGRRGLARLSESEEFVTFIELREDAQVRGGDGGLPSMKARDIDLDYTDDGLMLERVVMAGNATVAMAGGPGTLKSMTAEKIAVDYADDGAALERVEMAGAATVALAGSGGAAGREMAGQQLTLDLAPDGSLKRATGRDGVRLGLPADDDSPARTIGAKALDGTGVPGKGLTSVRFTDDVAYREIGAKAAPRSARSQALVVSLDGNAVSGAMFTGRVTFTEGKLEASAASIDYSPSKGTLDLSGTDAGGGPLVADERIRLESSEIELEIATRRMNAKGSVKTTLQAAAAEPTGRGAARGASRMPALLKQDEAVRVNAGTLAYNGDTGRAEYSGDVVLRQGTTVIRAGRLELDQSKGDFTATGAARATLVFESGTSEIQADVIRFDDAKRVVVYESTAPRLSALTEAESDLRAGRIQVSLAAEGSRVEKLDASRAVTITRGTRTVSATRLIYDALKEIYQLSGTGAALVSVVERTGQGAAATCTETTGTDLTFDRSSARFELSNNRGGRTTPARSVPCPAAPPRR